MGVVPTVDPAPRERRGSGSIVLVAALAVMLVMGLATWLVAAPRANAPEPASLNGTGAPAAVPAPVQRVSHAVTYELSGATGALNITYVAQGSEIAQVADAATPWSISIDHVSTAGSAQYFLLSAQNAGGGTLRCRIVVDGKVVSEASAAAPQGVVRCSKSMS
ncbi:MAG TPA: MmpS family transport accessory protein [Amycolatopsis sp.]|nr:MmpS family transport accessory protein [Amycolatopsis sp.]